MNIRDYLRILRKHWIIILVMTVVGLGMAAAYTFTRTPEYSAQSKVFVSTQTTGSISELAQAGTLSLQRVTTYANLSQTPAVLQKVINDLGLNTTPALLASQISASAPVNTSIIELSVTNPDPILAADIANSVSANLASVVDGLEKPVGESTAPIKLSQVQEAVASDTPVSPKVPLNLALGALIGLILGVGIALLRETLDLRIHNQKEVEAITDTPIVGSINFDSGAKTRPLIVHADPKSPRAEAFRSLRTNLQFLNTDQEAKGYVISSTVPGEGKSTTAANLAIAIADSGVNVLLVEADLRKPRATEYMGLEGAVGLSDVLAGRVVINDVIQRWGKTNVYVLPAGKIPPNPSELLGSQQMDTIIDQLDQTFEVVIYDCAPLLPVTDAAILAQKVGGLLLVVSAGKALKVHLQTVLKNLHTMNVHLRGIVMTMVPVKGANGYGYGYGYGYGDDIPKSKRKKRPTRV